MRHFIIISLISACLLLACKNGGEGLYFPDPEKELGQLEWSFTPDTLRYTFTNRSRHPLAINKVVSTDLKVKVIWPERAVQPGEKGELLVVIHTAKWRGKFAVRINVFVDGRQDPYRLKFSGVSGREEEKKFDYEKENIRMDKNSISFGDVFFGHVATDTICFQNSGQEMEQFHFSYLDKNLEGKADLCLLPGEMAKLPIRFNTEKRGEYGAFCVYVVVNRRGEPLVRIPVVGKVVENFGSLTSGEREQAPCIKIAEPEYDFGDVQEGKKVSKTFELQNIGEKDLIIRNITATCGCTVAEPDKRVVRPGEKCGLLVTFDTEGKTGSQYKTILVTCNDYRKPEVALRVKANIVKPERIKK